MSRNNTICTIFAAFIMSLLIGPLTGCGGDNDADLERALNKAGKNRGELEDVLSYYKANPEKYAAARWLIVNMPGHYGYEGEQIDSVQALMHSLLQYTVNFNFADSIIRKWRNFSYSSLPREDDIRTVSADFLIENIDMAYDDWKNRPWNKKLSFDDFCEKLLAYRVGDERVSSWRKIYRDYYMPKLDSLYQGDDVIEATKALHSVILDEGWIYNNELSLPHRDATSLFTTHVGSNRDQCDFLTFVMRSCGIPVSLETVIVSPDDGYVYLWVSVHDMIENRPIPFSFRELVPTRDRKVWNYKKRGKVYRICFSEQAEQRTRLSMIRSLSVRLNNPFFKDVTAEYFGHNTVDVPVDLGKGIVYAALYAPDRWRAVDVGRVSHGKAVFHDLEPGVMFVPAQLVGRNFEPCGYPFIYSPDGEVTTLVPDTAETVQMWLNRVRPLGFIERERLSTDVIGMVFEGSMEGSFSFMPDTIDVITDTVFSGSHVMHPSSGLKYRYLRVTAPEDRLLVISEIEAFTDLERNHKVGMEIVTDVPERNRKECATDGNLNQSFTAPAGMRSVVLRLDHAAQLKTIVFYPRTTGSFVKDLTPYTLYYMDGPNGWKSLGTRMSTFGGIAFEGPANALFRLDEENGNGNEQVFVYRNGKQMYAADFGDLRQ